MEFIGDEELQLYQNEISKRLIALIERIENFHLLCENSKEYDVYFEVILVQLRAMFIENTRYKGNYTSQVYMKKLGMESEVDRINSYLDEKITDDLSIREAIKTIVDKHIVHYDYLSDKDVEKIEICKNALKNKDSKHYLWKFALGLALATADGELKAILRKSL